MVLKPLGAGSNHIKGSEYGETSAAIPAQFIRKASMHLVLFFAPLDASATVTDGMVGIAALTHPTNPVISDRVTDHLPECPVSSYSRIASICGWINSMKSRACCDTYFPFLTTTP